MNEKLKKEEMQSLQNILRHRYSDKNKDTNTYLFFGCRINPELLTEEMCKDIKNLIDIESEGVKYKCIYDERCIDFLTKEQAEGIPLDIVKFFHYKRFPHKEFSFYSYIHSFLKNFGINIDLKDFGYINIE